ncbi:MAG: SPOR domain-containing protein [Acidobacteriota bacterium]|nr:MAG: SPOR domain-containing protein [Acidobacteriota bacterium]
MARKLEPRESFVIYACIVFFAAGLFTAGLHLGKSYASTERPEVRIDPPVAGQEPSVESLKTELEFYDDLDEPTVAAPPSRPEPAVSSAEPVVEETIERPVEVEPRAVDSSTPSSGSYTIQVAAHSTEAEAGHTLTRLEVHNFKGEIVPPDPSSGNNYYRIWVGRFPSVNAARDVESKLKEQGFYTYIRRID